MPLLSLSTLSLHGSYEFLLCRVPLSPPSSVRAMPSVAPYALAYGLMVLAQSRGPAIIGLLHGAEARRAAEAPADDVSGADAQPLATLCAAYEAHHYDSTSNVLHAVGTAVSLATLAISLAAPGLRPARRVALLLRIPPLWYLWAWAGHFLVQRDIPAVFTYGMTLRGWASGEWCSLLAFLGLRTTPRAHEVAAVAVLSVAHFYVLPTGGGPWAAAVARRKAA